MLGKSADFHDDQVGTAQHHWLGPSARTRVSAVAQAACQPHIDRTTSMIGQKRRSRKLDVRSGCGCEQPVVGRSALSHIIGRYSLGAEHSNRVDWRL